MFALLVGANAIVWMLAFFFFSSPHAVLLGTALLAYAFGLRHAVDPDHIAAIDNVTRKLMHDGKKPVGIGFYFSLGHSTIVVVLTLLIVLGASTVRAHLPAVENFGNVMGTTISAAFLFLIAAINVFVLFDILQLRRVSSPAAEADSRLNSTLDRRGIFGWLFRPMLRLVSRNSDMYFVGLLFGLGFDTATEVGLLGIAAIEAGRGLPIWSILLFPALFTAGMSLVDTADGILMLGAYGWAFVNPARKLYYNVTMTAASVLVALAVAVVEISNLSLGTLSSGWLAFVTAITRFPVRL